MPTILKKLFQKKWQSSNPDARIDAINAMQWQQNEQREILLKLAQSDPEKKVRQQAIAKIPDPVILLKMLAAADSSIQDVLISQLARNIKDEQTLLEGFKQLSDDNHRYLVLQHLNHAELRQTGLKVIQSPAILAEIAIQGNSSRLRQQAAEQLQDSQRLEEVMKASMNKDKGVYQIVKGKLTARKDAEKRQQQLRQQVDDLCATLESHAVSEGAHLYEAKFEALLSQWRAIETQADQDQSGRADRAIRTCAERIRRTKELEERKAQEQKQHQTLQQERLTTCETLEQALDSLHQAENPSLASLSSLDALIKTQETRWLEATKDVSVDKSEQKRYQHVMQQLRHYFVALQKYLASEEKLRELTQFKEQPDAAHVNQDVIAKELRNLLDEIQWPENFAVPMTLKDAQASLGQIRELRKQHVEDLKKLRQTVDQTIKNLEKELDDRSLKNSTRLFKDVQKLIHRLPSALEQEYQGKLRLLQGRIQDLRDWQGFATKPKQIELCERMEHLAEQHLDPQVKAQRIRELQNEWRTLGGSSDQSLWSRFKSASDKAYEPCQIFFSEHDLLKQANLDKREILCEQLQNFLDHVNWENVDWKAMDKISRKAREEWHRYYPVDHKRNKPLQKQFHKLIDEIENHLLEERRRNAAHKADIVQRADALITLEDARQAAQQAKVLQKEWELIGITDHREDRQLWKSFRAACDQIFSKLGEQREHHQKEVQDRVHQGEQLCVALEQLAAATPSEDTEQEFDKLQHAFKALGHLPREQHHTLQDRYQRAVHTIKGILKQQHLEQNTVHWRELEHIAETLARYEDAHIAGEAAEEAPVIPKIHDIPSKILEQLQARRDRAHHVTMADYQNNQDEAKLLSIKAEIAAEIESPEPFKQQRMEYQMNRLSEGFHSGGISKNHFADVTEVLASWYGLGPVEPHLRTQLQTRFNKALEHVLKRSHH